MKWNNKFINTTAQSVAVGSWVEKVPSTLFHFLTSFRWLDTAPLAFKMYPLTERKATIIGAYGCWIPPEYFENIQWYHIHSATPKLIVTQSVGGTLLYLSTLGGE